MKRNIIETVLGAIVLLVAAAFLAYSTSATSAGAVEGYGISASFNEVGGLKTGDDVRVGGVKVGTVESIHLDSDTYRAKVALSIRDDVKLPKDTAARISSESLMGGTYLALDVGGDEDMIPPGGQIAYTQDAQNLETLLGKFIFSMSGSKDGGDKSASAAPRPAAPAQPQGLPDSIAPLPAME